MASNQDNSIILTPEQMMRRRREYQELLRPFDEAVVHVLSRTMTKVIVSNGKMKITYPFSTLRVLAGIRIGARDTLRIHGYEEVIKREI